MGELALVDIKIMTSLARQAHRILEFGCGGSTMIWAQFAPPGARIVSVEHDPQWIEATKTNLNKLGVLPRVEFATDREWETRINRGDWFDLVLVDSGDAACRTRFEFATDAWPYLQPDGVLVVHDTHIHYGHDLLRWCAPRLLEIELIEVNKHSSLTTVVHKRSRHFVGDTDAFERLEPWQSGHASTPMWWPPNRKR